MPKLHTQPVLLDLGNGNFFLGASVNLGYLFSVLLLQARPFDAPDDAPAAKKASATQGASLFIEHWLKCDKDNVNAQEAKRRFEVTEAARIKAVKESGAAGSSSTFDGGSSSRPPPKADDGRAEDVKRVGLRFRQKVKTN